MDVAVVSAICASAMAVLAVFGITVKYGYDKGRSDTRLDSLEKAVGDAAAIGGVLGTLSATVEGLKASIDRLDRALEHLDLKVSGARRGAA